MKSLSMTTQRRLCWLGLGRESARRRNETKSLAAVEQLESRIVLSYTSVVNPIAKTVTLTTDGNPCELIITQDPITGDLVHNNSLLNVTGNSDWESGGPATTVLADPTWSIIINPNAGDTLELGDLGAPASNILTHVVVNGSHSSTTINDSASTANAPTYTGGAIAP